MRMLARRATRRVTSVRAPFAQPGSSRQLPAEDVKALQWVVVPRRTVAARVTHAGYGLNAQVAVEVRNVPPQRRGRALDVDPVIAAAVRRVGGHDRAGRRRGHEDPVGVDITSLSATTLCRPLKIRIASVTKRPSALQQLETRFPTMLLREPCTSRAGA